MTQVITRPITDRMWAMHDRQRPEMVAHVTDILLGDQYSFEDNRDFQDNVRELIDGSGELFTRLTDCELEDAALILADEFDSMYGQD